MDLLRYRVSGIPRLSGQQLLEPLPEVAKIARVEVDKANPWEMATYEDLRRPRFRGTGRFRNLSFCESQQAPSYSSATKMEVMLAHYCVATVLARICLPVWGDFGLLIDAACA